MAETAVTIRHVDWTHADASLLRDAQQQEINSSGLRPLGPGIPASASNVTIFLVVYEGDEPVGCGGLRPLDSLGLQGQAEIKRMYVVPSRRNADNGGSEDKPSVAQIVLEALEQAARENGWMLLKVETSKMMLQAMRFYEKQGYAPCEVFGAYVGNEYAACCEKHMV